MNRESRCDILIVGGGTGGCAAALAATSLGKRVIMTEPNDWVGGQLTSQAVPPDENLRIDECGGTRRYRDFREAVRQFYRDHHPLTRAARDNPRLNPGGGYVSGLCFEPRVGHVILENMLAWPRAKGLLEVRLHREPVSAQTDGDRVTGVTLRHRYTGELETITAPFVLDATELGDLLPLARVESVRGAESQRETGEPHAVAGDPQPDNVQAITWCFPVAWDTTPGAHHVIEKPEQYDRWLAYVPQTTPPWGGPLLSWFMNDGRSGRRLERALFLRPGSPPEWFRGLWGYRKIVCADHYPVEQRPHEVSLVNWPQNDYFVEHPLDKSPKEVARIFHDAKQLSLSLLYWMQTGAPRHDGGTGYPELYLRPDLTGTDDGFAQYPYIRESRRIRAEFTVLEQHVSAEARGPWPAEPFADSVGIGHYMIDLHASTTGVHDINVAAKPFQIPLGALLPVRVENLLPAGKNLGVTHVTNGCYRLHPIEWNIGEAAGLLAAFCLVQGLRPRAVRSNARRLEEFQNLLREQGFVLAWPEER